MLKQVKDLQSFVGTLPGITGSLSMVDYLELLESGLNKTGESDILVDESGKVIAGGSGADVLGESRQPARRC